MEKLFLILFLSCSNGICLNAQKTLLHQLWTTDTVFPLPESVLYDAGDNILYVSLMDGSSTEKDGKGGIAKLSLDGKIVNLNWISGLNAPKGMGIYQNILYAADLTDIVLIDTKQQKIIKKITIDSSIVLNDVTISKNGIVYISDHKAHKVFKFQDGIVSVYLSNLQKPNGLKAIDDNLYVLDSGYLYRFDKNRNKTIISSGMDDKTDGIELIKTGQYIVTSWNGIIYLVNKNGSKNILKDMSVEGYYSADLGYDPRKNVIYVPSLARKTVIAYSIKYQ